MGGRRRRCRDVGGGGCERHNTYLHRLPRRGCPDTWPPRHTCPNNPDKRRDPPRASCHGHPELRQAVPYRYSPLRQRADSGPNGAIVRRGDISRALAFHVVFAQAIEIAQTIALSLTLTVAFAYGIPVPLVIYVAAGGLRPSRPETGRARNSRRTSPAWRLRPPPAQSSARAGTR